jgi:hypothetical protein
MLRYGHTSLILQRLGQARRVPLRETMHEHGDSLHINHPDLLGRFPPDATSEPRQITVHGVANQTDGIISLAQRPDSLGQQGGNIALSGNHLRGAKGEGKRIDLAVPTSQVRVLLHADVLDLELAWFRFRPAAKIHLGDADLEEPAGHGLHVPLFRVDGQEDDAFGGVAYEVLQGREVLFASFRLLHCE